MHAPQSAILSDSGPHGLFLTLHLKSDEESHQSVRRAAAAFPSLLQSVAAIDSSARLVATLAFGPELWQALHDTQPAGFHPFVALGSGEISAPATGGDLFLHIHSLRQDLNYQLGSELMRLLRPHVTQADECHGFRYLDLRDLTGFIDGTENPEGESERAEAALIGEHDPDFSGGSFLITQRYIHRLRDWEQLPQHAQERVFGRTKPDSLELSDEEKPASAHIARVVIEEEGEELEIVRHSLPYGSASGDAGLFFIAYSKDLATFDKMLARMFGLSDDGEHDRLMEFTRAVSGGYFFAPSERMLESLAQGR